MTRNDLNPQFNEGAIPQAAIAAIELNCVPLGIEVANTILWEAQIEMLFSEPVQPGKYVMLFTGSVQSLESALRQGLETGATSIVDSLFLPQAHEQIALGLKRSGKINGSLDALGVIQTSTVCSAIQAADVALKTSAVDLLDLRIANGLGGKSFFTVTGEVSDVRSAVMAGAKDAQSKGQLMREVVIPRPHPDLVRFL